MNIQQQLNHSFTQALHRAGVSESFQALVKPSTHARFGHYQVNGIMPAAKALKTNPRALAQQVIDQYRMDAMVQSVEIAGPGFINITLSTDWLAQQVEQIVACHRAMIPLTDTPDRVAVDYSAPNIAKEMHVGHIRSTIIGDAMVRVLEFLGHTVIRCNHIGDWGTQFGMLIAHLEQLLQDGDHPLDSTLADWETFYRQAKQRYDTDTEFAKTARSYVVKLQNHDPWCLKMWHQLVALTMEQNQRTYDRLNVSLSPQDAMGESTYNAMLEPLLEALKQKGLAVESQGAQVVFLEEFTNKEGQPMGVIVQKRDGGYLYTTTDIACVKYRYEHFGVNRILYYVDTRQAQHLQQVWSIARKAGFVPDSVRLEHHAFGMILGKDGRPFKTRSGDTIKLTDLMDEAWQRSSGLIQDKSPQLDAKQRKLAIQAIAIGAIKYADLSKNRTTDYVFDWDHMLAFEGNTAPYLLYAYTRICSIFRKAGVDRHTLCGKVLLSEPAEQNLAVILCQFNEKIDDVATKGCPHILCAYLYELASALMTFYEACPINKSGVAMEVVTSRLNLCQASAKTLQIGLDLLGLYTIEHM